MPERREPYVKPEVKQFEYQVDPRVTLAFSCKDFQAATGPAAAGCNGIPVGSCQDTTAS